MAVQFAVLASGSLGNSTLIRAGGAGLLIDLGVGPRALGERLASVGAKWDTVAAAILTHTHGDHVEDSTLHGMARRHIPFYVHEGHVPALRLYSGFAALEQAGLTRVYDDRPFLTPNGVRVESVELRHDGGPTFGFRVEAKEHRGKRSVAIGYMADTGSWSIAMADALAEVDVLGVEFNHDVELQRNSDRHPRLIARNLGDRGHLSNRQGAEFVAEVLARSGRSAPRHLVLLHLSGQCNRPNIAIKTAREAIRSSGRRIVVHAALQAPPHPNLWLEPARRNSPGHASRLADEPQAPF
jgi:ribonuclease BN (tRNA processing enzyme)